MYINHDPNQGNTASCEEKQKGQVRDRKGSALCSCAWCSTHLLSQTPPFSSFLSTTAIHTVSPSANITPALMT